MFNIGDTVTRNSYNNDIVFVITDIIDGVAYLKGDSLRLIADAPLSDLSISNQRDEFDPDIDDYNFNRDEYFYMPAKILHLDGDNDYLEKSLRYYKKCGVHAYGKTVSEADMASELEYVLKDYKPDILVITGHDAYNLKNGDVKDVKNYKNSKFFADAIKVAREYESSHEKLVIIAGACQSDYEYLLTNGANFASSPKRVNIHALDPAIIAVDIALTEKSKSIDIKKLLSKTKYGSDGIGGIITNGTMFVGYPR